MGEDDGFEAGRERTRGTAFAVLLEEFREARRSLDDDEPGVGALTETLLREVFRSAWKHQFDDERSEFRSEVKQIVEDAVQEMSLEESEVAE